MSFKSYAFRSLPDGSLELTDPQPLAFSGRHGLIARFVRAEPENAARQWKLSPDDLHALAFPDGTATRRVIVFEETSGNTLALHWLQSVHGVSSLRTGMLFRLLSLSIERAASPLRVRHPAVSRPHIEELMLEGGTLAPDAAWHWSEPLPPLGGVVLNRSPALRLNPA